MNTIASFSRYASNHGKQMTHIISFISFSNAFDCVIISHSLFVFLASLRATGFSNEVLKWLRSDLADIRHIMCGLAECLFEYEGSDLP